MSEFHVTILRSYFNGLKGRDLKLIHYAIQIDGKGIYEFGRYDGQTGAGAAGAESGEVKHVSGAALRQMQSGGTNSGGN